VGEKGEFFMPKWGEFFDGILYPKRERFLYPYYCYIFNIILYYFYTYFYILFVGF